MKKGFAKILVGALIFKSNITPLEKCKENVRKYDARNTPLDEYFLKITICV